MEKLLDCLAFGRDERTSSINSSPGFDNDAFDILEKKAKQYFEADKKKLIIACAKDEIHIRTQSQFNAYRMKFDGFVDMGKNLTSQGILPLAKEALVFLVCGIEEEFKIPVAYFFINSLDTEQSAFITNQVLTRLSQIGVEVMTLTIMMVPGQIYPCANILVRASTEEHTSAILWMKRERYIYNARSTAHVEIGA